MTGAGPWYWFGASFPLPPTHVPLLMSMSLLSFRRSNTEWCHAQNWLPGQQKQSFKAQGAFDVVHSGERAEIGISYLAGSQLGSPVQ
jgi:hypothetical protein